VGAKEQALCAVIDQKNNRSYLDRRDNEDGEVQVYYQTNGGKTSLFITCLILCSVDTKGLTFQGGTNDKSWVRQ
jgi:hypothetical protein